MLELPFFKFCHFFPQENTEGEVCALLRINLLPRFLQDRMKPPSPARCFEGRLPPPAGLSVWACPGSPVAFCPASVHACKLLPTLGVPLPPPSQANQLPLTPPPCHRAAPPQSLSALPASGLPRTSCGVFRHSGANPTLTSNARHLSSSLALSSWGPGV